MPNFIIDSIDFEYTIGGTPVTATIEARVERNGFKIDIEAVLPYSALQSIHAVVIPELQKYWENVSGLKSMTISPQPNVDV